MTVYISQHVRGRNYEDAGKFGDLEVLVSNVENIDLYSTAPVVRSMNRKLRNFNDQDYILFSGDPVAIAIASGIVIREPNFVWRIISFARSLMARLRSYADNAAQPFFVQCLDIMSHFVI